VNDLTNSVGATLLLGCDEA
jgi:DNA-binding response OmpR family regulator